MSMMQTQQRNVPTLRFPEFSGAWDSLKLGDIAAFSKGKGISKADIDANGAFECIRYGQLYTDYFETIKDIKSRTNIPAKELIFSDANDIIIPASGETQIDIATASCVLKGGIALGGDLNIVKTEHDGVFLSYYLNSTRKYDIARLSQGISVVHLYAAQLKMLHLNLPQVNEQQKIASFLSSVDGKIEQLGKKKALLEQYKKGMMQRLFSQELRFKDAQGNDFPDWEEKRLGKLAKITTGKLDANAMMPEGPYRFYTCAKQYFQIDRYAFDTDALLVSGNGANVGYVHHYKGKFNAYQRTYVLDGFFDKILYVKFYLDYFLERRIGVEKKDGNTPYIVMSTLSEMLIALPCSSEQQKIADFLSSIDQKIDLVSTELNHAKTFKKGLLQQMFI